jgi:hypothetical protein
MANILANDLFEAEVIVNLTTNWAQKVTSTRQQAQFYSSPDFHEHLPYICFLPKFIWIKPKFI